MYTAIFKNSNLKTFTIISFVTGFSIGLFSFVGHFLTPTKLIPSSFFGGTVGIILGNYLCFKQKVIDKTNLLPVMLFTFITFGFISLIIVFNFNHPFLIIGSFSLIGLTSILSNNYLKKHPDTSRTKLYGVISIPLILPALYFVTASILKFQFGCSFFFNFIDTFLSRPNRQENFNAITPFLFGGGLLLSFFLNAFSQIEIIKKRNGFFHYKISGLRIKTFNLSILIMTGLTGIVIATYLVFENFT